MSKFQKAPVTSEPEPFPVIISIRAKSVRDNKNGTFTLELKGRSISEEFQRMIEEHLPDLADAAYNLLNKQALIDSLATSVEVRRSPDSESLKNKYPLSPEPHD